jgi:hypothetical protein
MINSVIFYIYSVSLSSECVDENSDFEEINMVLGCRTFLEK